MAEEERHKIDKALNEIYELENYFNLSLDLLCIADTEGYFRKLNPEWEKVLGYALNEIENKKFIEFVHPDDVDSTLKVLSQLSEKIDMLNFKNRYRCKDGSYRWFEWRSTIAKKGLIYAIARDITEHVKTEERLQKSEERYKKITSAITDYIYTVYLRNGEVIKTVHGPGCIAVTGYSEEEFKQDSYLWIKIVHPEDCPLVEKHANNLAKGIESPSIEHRIFHKTGEIRWVQNTPVLHFDEEGNLLSYDGLIKDITYKKKAEEAIIKEKKFTELILDSLPGLFYIYEIDKESPEESRLVRFNKKHSTLTGYSPEQLYGMKIKDWFEPEVLKRAVKAIKKVITEGESQFNLDLRVRNGSTIPHTFTGRLLEIDNKMYFFGMGLDISNIKKLEEQLFHAQKLEAIGTLAGGIAHNFNNLLMGILGYTSLMLLKIDEEHPFYKKLKIIEKLVDSGSELTKQLLGFARKGKYETKPININELIIETSEMFISAKKEITLQRNLQENLDIVEADRGQIEQVLINLYLNAWQAMPSGGKLYIETKNTFVDENESTVYDLKSGEYVKISISDTGVGMDEDTLQRIFEPFFTTREPNEGTGLGLASSYGIIRNHGGTITVYSKKGYGTTFTIYLPVSNIQASEEHNITDLKPFKGDETILIVDDETINTDAVKELLGALGYRVLTVKNGREAVEKYKKHLQEIKLVILDIIMPDMSGRETFEKLKEINKDIKVLLSSGYSMNGEASNLLDLGCKGFIQKPYKVEELTKKIREVLDE